LDRNLSSHLFTKNIRPERDKILAGIGGIAQAANTLKDKGGGPAQLIGQEKRGPAGFRPLPGG
jgi:hypothetical protein